MCVPVAVSVCIYVQQQVIEIFRAAAHAPNWKLTMQIFHLQQKPNIIPQ